MIGNGENKKSMAYIGNIVAFLEACISSNQKSGIFNYVDTPDLTMNDLVRKCVMRLGVNIMLVYGYRIGWEWL